MGIFDKKSKEFEIKKDSINRNYIEIGGKRIYSTIGEQLKPSGYRRCFEINNTQHFFDFGAKYITISL